MDKCSASSLCIDGRGLTTTSYIPFAMPKRFLHNHKIITALLNAWYLILLLLLGLLSGVLEVILEDWLWVGGEALWYVSMKL